MAVIRHIDSQSVSIDALDLAIISQVQEDGRVPLTKLGRKLGISHGTARNRLERLLAAGVLRIAATVDPLKVGSPVQVLIGINSDLARMTEIEKQLAEFDEVTFAATITGRLDFVVGAAFRSATHLREFLAEELSKIKGIHGIETLHMLNLGKRVWQWAVPAPADRKRLKARSIGRKEQGAADARLKEPINGRRSRSRPGLR